MSLCHAHSALSAGSAGALFLLGLAGSAHCLGMCGPLSCLLSAEAASEPEGRRPGEGRAQPRSLGAYHLGRALAYAAVGLAFAGLGQPLQPLLSWPLLALLAALPLLAYALRGREALPAWLGSWHAKAALRLRALPPGLRGLGLGLLTPALPCGLLYAAASASLAAPSPLTGALWMLSFAAGTLPALALGQAGFQWASLRRPAWAQGLRRGAALVAALSLLALALSA